MLNGCVAGPGDLIVVGASRYRWLPGGVARGVVRDATCPVVVVPRPEMARIAGTSGKHIARELMRQAR